MFEQLIAERESRFQVIDRIKSRLPDVPEEEVLHDVAEALSATRQMKKTNAK
jgi:hypothetical protein